MKKDDILKLWANEVAKHKEHFLLCAYGEDDTLTTSLVAGDLERIGAAIGRIIQLIASELDISIEDAVNFVFEAEEFERIEQETARLKLSGPQN